MLSITVQQGGRGIGSCLRPKSVRYERDARSSCKGHGLRVLLPVNMKSHCQLKLKQSSEVVEQDTMKYCIIQPHLSERGRLQGTGCRRQTGGAFGLSPSTLHNSRCNDRLSRAKVANRGRVRFPHIYIHPPHLSSSTVDTAGQLISTKALICTITSQTQWHHHKPLTAMPTPRPRQRRHSSPA